MSDIGPKWIAAWLAALLLVATPCVAQVTLVKGGAPAATLVIADEAGEKVQRAASELNDYVEEMSGARLPLATDADEVAGAL